jgi:hypothetical protein
LLHVPLPWCTPKEDHSACSYLNAFFSALAGSFLANLAAANPLFLPVNVNIRLPQKNRTYTENSVPIAFTYTSSSGFGVPDKSLSERYSYVLDDQELVIFHPDFNGSLYSSVISGLSDGFHNLTVYVAVGLPEKYDMVYYRGRSSIFFTVDTAPAVPDQTGATGVPNEEDTATYLFEFFPASLLIYIAIVVSAAVVSFGLVAYFLRRKKRRQT